MFKVSLLEHHQYLFRVSAENKCGVGEPLESASAITAEEPVQVPQPPRDAKVTLTMSNSVSLAWSKPEWNGGSPVLSYQLLATKRGTDEPIEIDTKSTECSHM